TSSPAHLLTSLPHYCRLLPPRIQLLLDWRAPLVTMKGMVSLRGTARGRSWRRLVQSRHVQGERQIMSHIVRPLRWFLAVSLVALTAVLGWAEEKKYAVIFLKDGFVLQGEVQRKTTHIFDNGQIIPIKEG